MCVFLFSGRIFEFLISKSQEKKDFLRIMHLCTYWISNYVSSERRMNFFPEFLASGWFAVNMYGHRKYTDLHKSAV